MKSNATRLSSNARTNFEAVPCNFGYRLILTNLREPNVVKSHEKLNAAHTINFAQTVILYDQKVLVFKNSVEEPGWGVGGWVGGGKKHLV